MNGRLRGQGITGALEVLCWFGKGLYLVVFIRVVGLDRAVGLVPSVPVSALVRTLAVQVRRSAGAAAVAGTVARTGVVGGRRRGDRRRFSGDRQRRLHVKLGHHHHVVVHDVVGQHGLVVHEVHRRGGRRGRRGRVVDGRRFETGGRRTGTQHKAHHRYGKVKREQYELSVESVRE